MADAEADFGSSAGTRYPDSAASGTIYLEWTPSGVGAIVSAALSFVLLAFGSALGLAVASPSSTWRDTSAVLCLLSGLWLLLTSLASFGLGGYLAGRLRIPLRPHSRDEVEFRDGIHGLLVWALAVLIGAVIAIAASSTTGAGRSIENPQLQNRFSLWNSISCSALTVGPLILAIQNLERKQQGSSRLVSATATWRWRTPPISFGLVEMRRGLPRQMLRTASRRL